MTFPLGSVITKFQNTFILTDPWYIRGLELWRKVLTIPILPDALGLTGLLPVKVVPDTVNDRVNVFFDIADLDSVFDANGLQLPRDKANGLLQGNLSSVPKVASNIQKVESIAPIQSVSQEGVEVLYFDCTVLPNIDSADAVSTSQTSSDNTEVNSVLPMVDEFSGSTVTFSFNILNLTSV
jgi:hypothetical protein